MVQAIQVLRFHLLELEKVSITYITLDNQHDFNEMLVPHHILRKKKRKKIFSLGENL